MIATRGPALAATRAREGVRMDDNQGPRLLGALAWLVLAGCSGQPQSSPTEDGTADPQTLRGGGAGAHAESIVQGVTMLPAATPAQLRELERLVAPQLARPQSVDVEVLDDGTEVMHPGEGYYHVTAAVVRQDGRFEVVCLEHPSIPDHRHPVKELR